MTSSLTVQDFERLQGAPVFGSDGERIGSVEKLFLDVDTQRPEWLGVGTGFLHMKSALVPVQGARAEGDRIQVAYDSERVQSSPDIDEDRLGESAEAELYAHYGLDYRNRPSDTGSPEGGPQAASGDGQESLTRHEEELKVGKREIEVGRLRVHTWVTTEPVEADVELRQEKAQIRREPIEQPVSGVDLEEREIEVPIFGEEPVVEKQTVAKERISLEKDQDTRTEHVAEEVRKEQVETDGEDVETEQRN